MAAERKINGAAYRFEPLLGWEAYDALGLLLKTAGPFAGLLEAVSETDKGKRDTAMARALPEILMRHDSGLLRQLLEALIGNVTVDGQKAVVGVKPGDLDELAQVGAFAIEAQFSSFFGGAGVAKLLAILDKEEKAAA